jgi:mxaJ protein
MRSRVLPRGNPVALAGMVGCACILACTAPPAAAQQPAVQQPAAQQQAPDTGPGRDKVLRVCQDPNNMPFSNRAEAGFENKIAALFAKELGWKLETTWFPQRIGFIRNTLRAKQENSEEYKCDLVTGVPSGYEMAATTRPYYHSTYALVYAKGRGKGMDGVRDMEDLAALAPAQRSKLRIGVFAGSPVTDWLLANDLMGQVEWYQVQTGDADQYPGQVVERDLASGKIDVAFIWGPIAGYFARTTRAAAIVAVTLKPRAGMKLDYDIAMGVRQSDKAFRQRIDELIGANQVKINAILEDYGVPMVGKDGQVLQAARQGKTP